MSEITLELPSEADWQRALAHMWILSLSALEITGEYGRWLDEAHRRITEVVGQDRADALMAEAMGEAAQEPSDVLFWAHRWVQELAADVLYADEETT